MYRMTHADILYRGRVYRRHPDSERLHLRRYYQATTAPRTYLHRDVYADNHGPIPDGWHVHHRDHDTENNDPSNLEALTPEAHRAHHGTPARHEVDCEHCGQPFMAAAVTRARWCTPRCKQAARRAAGLVTPSPRKGPFREERTCDECSNPYLARQPWARFCRSACKQRHARRMGALARTVRPGPA